jgi:hypothetical protein
MSIIPTEPINLEAYEERALRFKHKAHPYCDACKVLRQLDIERAAYALEVFAMRVQIRNLQEKLDEEKDLEARLCGDGAQPIPREPSGPT